MRIYMQMSATEDRAPRFFQLFLQPDLLEGWSLVIESGYQGGRGRVKREYFDNREDAEAALLAVRDAQIKRGYQVVFVEGARP